MWMYLGPSCPDNPFSAEFVDMEVNTWIRGVPAHGVNSNFGSDPAPLREGVDSFWVSLLELTSICLCRFLLISAYTFLCRILGYLSQSL
jgi:hypothetical protein